MRQSVAPSRSSQTNSAAAAAKLLEKKKEFDAVNALTRASALYLERIEGLSTDFDTMADTGQGSQRTYCLLIPFLMHVLVFGDVLVQWPKMFQILNLFRKSTNHMPRSLAYVSFISGISCGGKRRASSK